MWQPFPLPDGSYSDATRPWADQDVVNFLPAPAQQQGTRSPVKYQPVPGLHVFATVGNGPHRGAANVEGALYVVSGTTLYRVATDGTATALGTVPGTGLVSMTYNQVTGGNQIVIANGSSGYVYDTAEATFAQITDDAFVGFIACDFIGQYIVGVEPMRRFWYHSDLADATAYSTLDRYEAETSPDRIVGLIASHNELLIFGERTIEPWVNEPTENAAFQLNPGTVIERGCLSGNTIRRLDNSIFFLGDDRIVYRLNGYTPVPVSTQVMAAAFRDLDPRKAFAFTYEDAGHVIYYLTWGDGQTWGYDVTTQRWHRRESFGLDRWRVNTLVKWGSDWYAGDYRNGKLYKLAWGYTYEGCEIMPRRLRAGVLHANGNRLTVHGLRLGVVSGGEEGEPDCEETPTLIKVWGATPGGAGGVAIDDSQSFNSEVSGATNVTITGWYSPEYAYTYPPDTDPLPVDLTGYTFHSASAALTRTGTTWGTNIDNLPMGAGHWIVQLDVDGVVYLAAVYAKVGS